MNYKIMEQRNKDSEFTDLDLPVFSSLEEVVSVIRYMTPKMQEKFPDYKLKFVVVSDKVKMEQNLRFGHEFD